jgi:hypothetical protein
MLPTLLLYIPLTGLRHVDVSTLFAGLLLRRKISLANDNEADVPCNWKIGLTRGNSIFIMEILTHQSKHQWNSKSTVTEAKTFCKRRWNLPQATTKPTMAGWKNEMTRDTPEALSMTCYAESHHCLCLHYCLICLTHYLTTRLPIRLGLVS